MPIDFREKLRSQRMATAGLLAVLLALLPMTSRAVSMQVAPVRVALSAAHPVVAMTIGNGEDAEVAVQAEVLAWSQEDGNDVYSPTRDVLVNPSIFRLAPQGRQIVRVGLQAAAGAQERSYRIFLRQLPSAPPSALEGGGVRLQTLLRVGVPIFVPPQAPAVHDLRWRLEALPPAASAASAGRYALVVENHGSEHVQLVHVALALDRGGEVASKSLSHYVLAGATSVLPIELPPLAADAVLRVDARSDSPAAAPPVSVRAPRAAEASR
jgi:fimbrial chaperone protein